MSPHPPTSPSSAAGRDLVMAWVLTLGWLACLSPSGARAAPAEPAASHCADYNPYKNAYFGDLHVHTSFSLDAAAVGTFRSPADAFDFARGAPATLTNGEQVFIDGTPDTDGDGLGERPLDFLAVTDHAEWFDDVTFCIADQADDYGYYNDADGYCADIRSTEGTLNQLLRMSQVTSATPTPSPLCASDQAGAQACDQVVHDLWRTKPDPGFVMQGSEIWSTIFKAAQDANSPCSFTAFVGYEYSGNLDNANNHRNVIFRDDNVVDKPLDYISYPDLGDMLAAFEAACTGDCQAVLIPHNPNDSKGQKWILGSAAEADRRRRYERLVEIIQHKGASECYNRQDGTVDADYEEACSFEISEVFESGSADVEPGYVRNGLSLGLTYEDPAFNALGIDYNPFQLGFIGSTDTHNGTPGNTREETWPGHVGDHDQWPWLRLVYRQMKLGLGDANTMTTMSPNWGPGGLAGVWAEENTRDAIFSALWRRETFATSGTRMRVRMFQTWDQSDVCADPEFPRLLVDGGAQAMGSTFTAPAANTIVPRMVVQAFSDPDYGTDLASIQLIQAVLQDDGTVAYDLSRQQAVSGRDACVVFDLTDFDPSRYAYWYARVLQAPTPRWSKQACAEVAAAVEAALANDPNTPESCLCVRDPDDLTSPDDQGTWLDGPSDGPGGSLRRDDCTAADASTNFRRCYCACEQAHYVCLNQASTYDVDVAERAWTSPIWHVPAQPVPVDRPVALGALLVLLTLALRPVMRSGR